MVEQSQDYLHPFVNYLKSRIESLLALIQFEEGGKVVDPDGFRLKNLSAWSFEQHKSIFDSLGSFSSSCNLRCKFCYEEGNPITFEKTALSVQEAKTRIRYFRKSENRGLPIFRQRLYKEPFTNKELLHILNMVREADPDVEMHLTTNGSLLSEKILEKLSNLRPVNLSVSLNSSDPETRTRIMGDRKSDNSIKMFKRFKEYELPFAGSIVAWPEIDGAELKDTIQFLDNNMARMIRITLPGFSRFYSQNPPFKSKQVWDEVLKNVLPLREVINTPLLVLPSLYHSRALLPEIAGVIQSSPADRSGVRVGDVIKAINGKSVLTRAEAKELLVAGVINNTYVRIEFEREGKIAELQENKEECYPYRPRGYPASQSYPFGIVLIDDFNLSWFWGTLKRIKEVQAKHVLLMTSVIMEPVVAALLESLPGIDDILENTNIYLWVPKHRFWGGNIILGDLYTCSDYLDAIYDFQEKQQIVPDLVIIPSSFSPNGSTDLLGVSYSSIEHATGIPVELSRCSHITI